MKKIFISLVLIVLVTLPAMVLAQDLGLSRTQRAATEAGYSGATNATTLSETIGTVVRAALSLIGVIFTSLMVYAGYLWMTARGEEDKVTKAKDLIRAAIIGLILTLGAYSITAFVVPKVLERTGGAPTTT